MRRGSRVVHITVSTESAVSYKDYTVRVFRGNTWLYKFPNIRYFQVYNVIEGYQTYCRDAPEGREFPGYGRPLSYFGFSLSQTLFRPTLFCYTSEVSFSLSLINFHTEAQLL